MESAPAPPYASGTLIPGQAGLGQHLQVVPGELARLVDLGRPLGELLLEQPPPLPAEQLLVLGRANASVMSVTLPCVAAVSSILVAMPRPDSMGR